MPVQIAVLARLFRKDGVTPFRMNGGTTQERLDSLRSLASSKVEVKHVDSGLPEDGQLRELREASVVIPYGTGFPAAWAEQLPKLKLVQLFSAGFDHIPVAALRQRGVPVANNGGSNAVAVSEHTLSLILSLCRRMPEMIASAHAGRWAELVSGGLWQRFELTGKTVGIVGFGNVGRQVARKLSGFDVRLLYTDVVELMPGRDNELGAQAVPLERLLRESDIITLHVPLNRSTKAFIGAKEFEIMKPTAMLINTCRGPVVDEGALARALETGRILAAGLDVTVREPVDPASPLLRLPNCIVTPHLAGDAAERGRRENAFAVAQAGRAADGRPLLSIVEVEAGDGSEPLGANPGTGEQHGGASKL